MGKEAAKEVIQLQKLHDMLASCIENLMKVISDPTSPEYMALDAENKYNSVLSALEQISALLCQKECTLGPIEQQQL